MFVFFLPESYLAQIETGNVLADSRFIKGTMLFVFVCAFVCDPAYKRGGSWNLTRCQACVSIIFSWLWLYQCVAVIDLQGIGFLLFLWPCRSISFHFSLPSKFNLTYIERLTPLSICGRGKSIQSNRAHSVCKWMHQSLRTGSGFFQVCL